jgi:hypothetical protein
VIERRRIPPAMKYALLALAALSCAGRAPAPRRRPTLSPTMVGLVREEDRGRPLIWNDPASVTSSSTASPASTTRPTGPVTAPAGR